MHRAFQRCAASLPRALLRGSIDGLAFQSLPRAALRTTPRAQIPSVMRSLHQTVRLLQETEQVDSSKLTKFQELEEKGLINPRVVRSMTVGMGLETMTEVQSQTLTEALNGTDIIAQAKTGTGKTIAFLLPVLQNIIKIDPQLAQPVRGRRGPRTTADDIRALIISPTRELAEQIAAEAKKLCRDTGIIVQTAVGGTQKRAGMQAIQRDGCHILVGTPGRLKDILSDPYNRIEAPDLSALVFDEADRLLDEGFWPEMQAIMQLLPSSAEKDRQTLMFSATLPQSVVTLARSTLKPGFKFVQTVRADEEPTHQRVPQNLVQYRSFENAMPAVLELCTREIEAAQQDSSIPPFKAIIYFNSTADVNLAHSTMHRFTDGHANPDPFGTGTPVHALATVPVNQIHAKLTQGQRTRAANDFRRCKSGILLSTDVTARGMDFPGVTHVVQVGLPPNREQYIHRIGRTARAGKEGTGWLLVSDLEARELRNRLGSLPLRQNNELQLAKLDLGQAGNIPADAGKIMAMYQQAIQAVPREEKVRAFMGYFGTFAWQQPKSRLIESLNRLATFGWGLSPPPAISPSMVAKLGLRNIPGLNVGHEADDGGYDRRDGTRHERSGPRGGPSGGFRNVGPGYGRSTGYGDRDGGSSFGRRDRGDFGDRGGGSSYGGRDRRSGGSYGGQDRGYGGGGYGGRDRYDRPSRDRDSSSFY